MFDWFSGVFGTDGETLDVVRVTMASTFTHGTQSYKGEGKREAGRERRFRGGTASLHVRARRKAASLTGIRGEGGENHHRFRCPHLRRRALVARTVTGEERPAGAEEAYAVTHTSTTVKWSSRRRC